MAYINNWAHEYNWLEVKINRKDGYMAPTHIIPI